MTTGLRVLIVEDHPIYRDGLADTLSSAPGIEVVATADSGEAALELVAADAPDVVLMDLSLPGISGVEATAAVVDAAPDAGVLVLTMYREEELLFSAMRAGARGYLLKGASGDDIVRAVRSVGAGEAVFGEGVAERVLRHFASGRPAPEPFPDLTDRERQVLELLAQGLPNRDIGSRLFISDKTVRNNVSNILTKLQVTDRGQAIVAAREAGLPRRERDRAPGGRTGGRPDA